MPINLSAANKNAIYAMSLLDSQSLNIQQQLATGNAVNSAGDDPIKFFRSADLSARAKYLKTVSENTDLALANITAADKAMSQIKEQMTKLQDVVNSARATTASAGNPITTNSTKMFQSNNTTINRFGNALTSSNEALQTGYSLATTVRNKLLFDDNGTRGDGAFETYSGNVGINAANMVNFNQTSRITMQIQIGTDTVSVTLTNSAIKQNTIGDLVDQMNARINALAAPGALAGTRLWVDGEGRLRIDTAATTGNVRIGFGVDNGTGAATGPAVNDNDTQIVMNQLGFGRTFQKLDFSPGSYLSEGFGFDARFSNAYDVSMIGTTSDTFQDGDVFSISLIDRMGNTTQAFFRATSRDKMAQNEAQTGTQNSPIKFSTLGELVDAINGRLAGNAPTARLTAFADVASAGNLFDSFNPTANTNTRVSIAPTFRLRLVTGDANTQLRIQQTQNSDTNYTDVSRIQNGNGFITQRKIAANNLMSIFGAPSVDPATGLAGVSTRLSAANDTSDPSDPTNTTRTQEEYMTLSWVAAPSSNVDPKRLAARTQWQSTVRVIDEILRQGRLDMGGQPNILNGDQIRIQFAQDNSRTYTFNLANRFDRNFLQLGANDIDFGSDTAVDNVNNAITTGLNNLTIAQSTLASNSVSLTGFSAFYKDMATLYQSNADSMIKVDMNQASNTLKALQTMQQITQAVMGINNQNEQSVTRLLY